MRKSHAAVRYPQIQTAGIGPVPDADRLRLAPGTNACTRDAVSCLRFLGLSRSPGPLSGTVRAGYRNAPTRRSSGEGRVNVWFAMPTEQPGAGILPRARQGCILLRLNDQPNQAPHRQALVLGGNAQPLGLHRVDEPNASNPGAARPRNSN
jgi:hypothetical protein